MSLAKNIIFLYLCNRGNNNNNNNLLYLIYILFAPIYISILSSPRREPIYYLSHREPCIYRFL